MVTNSKTSPTYARVNVLGVVVQSSMVPFEAKNPGERFSYAATIVDNKRRDYIEHIELDGVQVATIRTFCTAYGWEHQYVVVHADLEIFKSLINNIEHDLCAIDVVYEEENPNSKRVRKRVENKKRSFIQLLLDIFRKKVSVSDIESK